MSTIEDWNVLCKGYQLKFRTLLTLMMPFICFQWLLMLLSTTSLSSGQPVGTIKAVHSGLGAHNVLPDEAYYKITLININYK